MVLVSARASSRTVCLPPETGDVHTLAATLLNVGEIIFSRKIGKVKNKKENLQGGKPKGPWLGEIGTMTIGLVLPRSPYASVGALHGRCLGGAWYGSRPSSWIRRPNSSGIDSVSHENVTNRGAYPSSWPGVGQ